MSQRARRPVWTEKNKRAILKLFREAQELLGLTHYEMRFEFIESAKTDSENDTETLAETFTNGTYLSAGIAIYKGFLETSPENQWVCAIHELLHVFFAPLDHYARRAICPANEPEYTRDMENIVVKLSRILAYARSKR